MPTWTVNKKHSKWLLDT